MFSTWRVREGLAAGGGGAAAIARRRWRGGGGGGRGVSLRAGAGSMLNDECGVAGLRGKWVWQKRSVVEVSKEHPSSERHHPGRDDERSVFVFQAPAGQQLVMRIVHGKGFSGLVLEKRRDAVQFERMAQDDLEEVWRPIVDERNFVPFPQEKAEGISDACRQQSGKTFDRTIAIRNGRPDSFVNPFSVWIAVPQFQMALPNVFFPASGPIRKGQAVVKDSPDLAVKQRIRDTPRRELVLVVDDKIVQGKPMKGLIQQEYGDIPVDAMDE